MTPKTLATVISDTKAASVLKHGSFPRGVAPRVLTKPSGYAFVVTDPTLAAAVEAAKVVGGIATYWVFKLDQAQHILISYGLLLVNMKQLIVPGKGLLQVV